MSKKRRFIFLFTRTLYIAWTLLLLIIFAIIVERTYTYAKFIATSEAKTNVNKDLAYRTWVASHGGVYVPVDKNTPPNPYLKNIKDRDFTALGKKFTLMNGAYTLSQIMKNSSKLYGIKTHITSKKLLNPNNRPDKWETLALNKIEKSRQQYIELSDIDSKTYLRLMNPLVTKKSCLKCHALQGYRVGDIRGGVSIAIPMQPLYKNALNSSLLVGFLFFIIWVVGIFLIIFLSKKIYRYINEQEELYEQYVYGLVAIVEKRDTYTAGHSTRVADYAVKIAKAMGYSDEECHTLHRAGMLHDIGKIGIPDSVFLKPSKLSSAEYALIQSHITLSYEMLKDISIFYEIKEIVRNHHEHFDGSGYPRGLRGDDTPMLSQILSLADAFDAMTTDRIYKGRKSVQEALQEIAKLSAKQFNPTIVSFALKALGSVVVNTYLNQSPTSSLENERFSYFYKDALTGVYNEEGFNASLNLLQTFRYLTWVSLHGTHQYNKTNNWQEGDKLLQNVAKRLQEFTHDEGKIYRFHGDNFLLICNKEVQIETLKENLHESTTKTSIEFTIKTTSLSKEKVQEIKSLENALQSFS